jgi:hypothetical protein
MNPGDIEKVAALRERHPRLWPTLPKEVQRAMLAETLGVDKKSLDRAYKLAKKYETAGQEGTSVGEGQS